MRNATCEQVQTNLLIQTKVCIHNEERGGTVGRVLEICILTLIANIKFSRKFSNLQHFLVTFMCALLLFVSSGVPKVWKK